MRGDHQGHFLHAYTSPITRGVASGIACKRRAGYYGIEGNTLTIGQIEEIQNHLHQYVDRLY
jgi:hypothetical protein